MKTRTGFVSNSSSSSFVLKVGEPFNTTLDVAEHMIPKREWEGDPELLAKVRKMKTSRGEQPNAVCFRSCNYDTFIAKMDGLFLISTCNNHSWEFPTESYSPKCPAEYYEYFGDEYFYNLSRSLDFYQLEFDFVGRRADGYGSYCQDCFHDLWRVEEKVICPNCERKRAQQ